LPSAIQGACRLCRCTWQVNDFLSGRWRLGGRSLERRKDLMSEVQQDEPKPTTKN
jgi:hypothetical protein